MNIYTKKFAEISKNDTSLAGGKGASLGEMTQAGIPVPEGYIVVSVAFQDFFKESGISADIESILSKVDQEKIYTIETASEQIQAIILQAQISSSLQKEIEDAFLELNTEFVAVRSSATAEDGVNAAWAGQLDTFLNTTKETLLTNVKHCWASLFSPRAIFYRIEKNLHKEEIAVAVVVQKMIQSEVSGVAFSVHPVTQDRNQILIEAGYGLGEAVVSGAITPDNYVIEKNTLNIFDKYISNQDKQLVKNDNKNEWTDLEENKQELQKLSDNKIQELSKLIVKIENHYGFPCDIEWGLFENKLYILQSRPITTLDNSDSKR
jgi:pyruvate,water dikinase